MYSPEIQSPYRQVPPVSFQDWMKAYCENSPHCDPILLFH